MLPLYQKYKGKGDKIAANLFTIEDKVKRDGACSEDLQEQTHTMRRGVVLDLFLTPRCGM